MIVVVGIMLIFACVIMVYYVSLMKKHNHAEYYAVEDLKRRIDELDVDNVDVDAGQKKSKIIVPDIVDADEATRVSTQKDECKVYEVRPNEKIEKTVIGSGKKEKDFVNTEIERMEDKKAEENDDPIKENEGLISKILKNNDEE